MDNTEKPKSVTEKIQSKDGYIRNNLGGKRTDQCARSVISSDPSISVGEYYTNDLRLYLESLAKPIDKK